MIYPAYKVTDAGGNFRTFFWFCFARLKDLDEHPRKVSDFLDTHYQAEGRRPYWDWNDDHGELTGAARVVTLEVALHAPEWDKGEVEQIAAHHLFRGVKISREDEFVVLSVDTRNKLVDEVMYPVFMFRDIFSAHPVFAAMKNKGGLSVVEAAFLASQFQLAKPFARDEYLEQVSDDYLLATSFEALACLLQKEMPYVGAKWGAYQGGYVDQGDYCCLPDTLFNVDKYGHLQDIEDITDVFDENPGNLDTVQIVIDCFKKAMENIRD